MWTRRYGRGPRSSPDTRLLDGVGCGAWDVGLQAHTPRPTPHAIWSYVSFPIGNRRIRFPVRAKIALHTAGAIGGVPGSPTPPCESLLGTMYTSTTGIPFIRSIW